MISKGIIEKIEKNDITIKFYKEASCAHCSGCSKDKKFGSTIKLSSSLAKKYVLGQEISVEIEDILILKLSLITYIFPAIFMILGYLVSDFLGAEEKTSIISSFLFLVVSFVFLFFYDKKRVKNYGSDVKII
ncbi:MAG: SoxR reducing system RseC family protein [Fusobacteriaceae bacterium]